MCKMLHINVIFWSLVIPALGKIQEIRPKNPIGENCDKFGVLIYEDLGCEPIQCDGKSCPSRYRCTGLDISKNHCVFRGKVYEEGEEVDNNLLSLSCNLGCSCALNTYSPEDPAHFQCAIVDCIDQIGPRPAPGCYYNYTQSDCCSGETICPPFNNLAVCEFGGKMYKEGERFYPDNTCWKCTCQKGFVGKLEAPFCRRHDCGEQLSYRGANVQNKCAPFYAKSQGETFCCPDDWICPDGSENIESKVSSKSENVCKFGSKTLKIGEKFEKAYFGHNRIKCECVIPPLLRCIKA